MSPRYARIFLISSLFLIGTASGATIYVPDDHPTIQDAINAAVNGDTIIVRMGTYPENINFSGKAITVKSEYGPEATIIDGGGVTSVVIIDSGGPDTVLDGFTLTNGNASFGGGIMCPYSDPTLINNIVTGNHAGYYGGGIYLRASSPTIACCIFHDNTAAKGGGIECYVSTPTIVNTTVTANTSSGSGGGISVEYNSYPVIANTIVWGNSGQTGPEIFDDSGALTIHYCDVKGGWAGTGNIDADPLFVEPAANDFHIPDDSPCKDAGSGTYIPAGVLTDYEGDGRIMQGSVDMGADEHATHLYRRGAASPGASFDIRATGMPLMAPVVLGVGTGVLDPPLQTPYGKLYLVLPPFRTFNLGAMPSSGVLIFTMKVPPGAPPGSAYPLQAIVGLPGGYSTRLTNLLMLPIE